MDLQSIGKSVYRVVPEVHVGVKNSSSGIALVLVNSRTDISSLKGVYRVLPVAEGRLEAL